MRTLFFFLLVISVIALLLYIKNKPDDSDNAVNTVDASSLSNAGWDSLLRGSWKVIESDSNSEEYWLRKMDIEFLDNHVFRLSGNEEYYQSPSPRPLLLMMVSGGGAIGKWNAKDGGFTLSFDTCDFSLSKSGYTFAKAPDKIVLLKCTDGENNIEFGNVSSLHFKSKIQTINNNKIVITGRNYAWNYDFRCQFLKVEE